MTYIGTFGSSQGRLGGHLVHLRFFRKYDFHKAAFYTLTKVFVCIPCDSSHKSYFLEFINLIFEKKITKFKIVA